MNLKHFALIAALVAAFAVAGCGDDNEEPADTGTTTEQATEETGATEEASADDESTEEGKPPKVSGSTKEKPEIATPEGAPPDELVIKDIKKGKGDKAKEGDEVTVHYVGLNWSNGQEFDSSWGRGDPATFPLEQGSLIDGWVEGIPGMREGGRRLLIIPPDQGYGAQGSPPTIPGNETLVFVVDLEKVK